MKSQIDTSNELRRNMEKLFGAPLGSFNPVEPIKENPVRINRTTGNEWVTSIEDELMADGENSVFHRINVKKERDSHTLLVSL